MFKAVKNPNAEKLSDREYKFGKLSVLEEIDVLKSFIERELSNKRTILEKLMEETTDKSRMRAEEIKGLIAELEEMLYEM
jgi:hypothetical protein